MEVAGVQLMVRLRALPSAMGSLLGPHGRRAMILVGGASAAQLIPLAIAPVLTRLYSPEEYGILAILGSISAILTAVAAGRYTMAILLPDNDRDAVQITGLALFLAASVSALLLILVPIAHWALDGVGVVHRLGGWIYLIPVSVFLSSMFESLGYFGLRKDKVGEMARANVLRTTVSGGTQVSLGLLGVGLPGLLGGYLIGLASGNARLIRIYANSLRTYRLRWSRMRSMAGTYSNFPKFDLWANLANSLSYNVFAIGVGAIYSYQAAGQYALAYRFTALPSVLVGVALSQVYMREAARRVQAPALALRAFYRTTTTLAAVSVVPMLVIALWGQEIFGLVFGPQWHLSGILASAMIPLVAARFISSPLTSVFLIYGRQRFFLLFQVILLATVLTTMTIAFRLGWSLQGLLVVQSSLMGGLYLGLLYFARRIIIQSAAPTVVEPPVEPPVTPVVEPPVE
jgi:O-antigen/teichoic acid export membrane protein